MRILKLYVIITRLRAVLTNAWPSQGRSCAPPRMSKSVSPGFSSEDGMPQVLHKKAAVAAAGEASPAGQ